MTLIEYRTRLSAIETAIDNVIKTGKSGSVNGSFAFENLSLEQLEAMRSKYRRTILRLLGKSFRRSRPDFSSMGSSSSEVPES
jgi:hypothetical protein